MFQQSQESNPGHCGWKAEILLTVRQPDSAVKIFHTEIKKWNEYLIYIAKHLKKLLIVPKCNLKTYGHRAFSYRAPTLWKALSDYIRQTDCLETFKAKLKTHLFRQF